MKKNREVEMKQCKEKYNAKQHCGPSKLNSTRSVGWPGDGANKKNIVGGSVGAIEMGVARFWGFMR